MKFICFVLLTLVYALYYKCPQTCEQVKIGDGVCDEICNIEECGYDFGDCGLTSSSSFKELKPLNHPALKNRNSQNLDDVKKDLASSTFIAIAVGFVFLCILFVGFILALVSKQQKHDSKAAVQVMPSSKNSTQDQKAS